MARNYDKLFKLVELKGWDAPEVLFTMEFMGVDQATLESRMDNAIGKSSRERANDILDSKRAEMDAFIDKHEFTILGNEYNGLAALATATAAHLAAENFRTEFGEFLTELRAEFDFPVTESLRIEWTAESDSGYELVLSGPDRGKRNQASPTYKGERVTWKHLLENVAGLDANKQSAALVLGESAKTANIEWNELVVTIKSGTPEYVAEMRDMGATIN